MLVGSAFADPRTALARFEAAVRHFSRTLGLPAKPVGRCARPLSRPARGAELFPGDDRVLLAGAFDCGVNDLPLSLVLSWYEQKAVCILLALLQYPDELWRPVALGIALVICPPPATWAQEDLVRWVDLEQDPQEIEG